MSDSRIKNSKRNLKSAIILQIINIILPFVVRTLILYKLGEEYQGLNGLFTSILQVLNLTDLGFSSAVVYILYKPIAIGDNDTVCALISYLKRVYRIIGIVILAIGLILLPFLKFLIKGSYPDEVNIYLLYLIYLSNSVISYWLFAYKTALLLAMQRADLTDKISSIIKSSMFIVQAVVLFVFGNYYVYVIFLPIFSIINNLLVQFVSKKYFPQITPHGKISENIKKEMKKRKKKFSGGNFKQYKNKSNEDKRDVGKEDNVSLNQIENEKEEFPLILIIVDGFVEFCEETYQRYDDSLYLILREGEKLGIKVMISIESFSGMYISMRIAELFKTKICLYMKDKYAYTEVFDVIQISVFPKAEIPGRGIAYYGERILEFQTALSLNLHN